MLGGICSGKSYVGRRVAELGPGRVIDADGLAHKALAAAAADGRLETTLGSGFVIDGKPDRDAVAAHVFSDAAALRRLERLIHPQVHLAVRSAIDEHRSARAGSPLAESPVLILDVPLLIEVGLDRSCHTLWFVDAPADVRAERAAARGLTMEQIAQRERFQSPLARKRARADLVIDNSTPPAELDEQIRRALADLGVPNVHAASAPRIN